MEDIRFEDCSPIKPKQRTQKEQEAYEQAAAKYNLGAWKTRKRNNHKIQSRRAVEDSRIVVTPPDLTKTVITIEQPRSIVELRKLVFDE